MNKSLASLVSLASLIAVAAPAFADLEFLEKSTDDTADLLKGTEEKRQRETQVFLKEGPPEQPNGSFGRAGTLKFIEGREVKLFRPAEKRMLYLYVDRKQFAEYSFGAISEWMYPARVRVREYLEKPPAELTEKQKKYLGLVQVHLGYLPTRVELRETADEQQISGKPCRRLEIFEDGERVAELWVTPGLEGFSTYAEMYETFHAVSPAVAARLKELPGFPVRGTLRVFWVFLGQLTTVRFEYSNFRETPIGSEQFEVPSDFRKIN